MSATVIFYLHVLKILDGLEEFSNFLSPQRLSSFAILLDFKELSPRRC